MNKIVHISTVHQRYDNRILLKECISLKNNGYDVSLIVADGKNDEIYNGIKIYDIGKYNSRLKRVLFSGRKAFVKAMKLKPDIYHFHDPELLLIAYFFALAGKSIVYDSHEDVPVQIRSKIYLNKYFRSTISIIYGFIEKQVSKKLKAIVSASTFIAIKFSTYNSQSIAIRNYPILGMFNNNIAWPNKENAILYIGGLNRNRGIKEVIEALEYCKKDITFYLGGNFDQADFKIELQSLPSYNQVDYRGYVYIKEYIDLSCKSKIGIITDYPIENYLDAFATKMYDYMEAGLPFVCSNFPKWVDFVNKHKCGIAVDPYNPKEIANAINHLLNNPDEAKRMGENGKVAIRKYYNWTNEEKKLLSLYGSILD